LNDFWIHSAIFNPSHGYSMDYIDEINIEYRKLYIFYERNILYEIKQDFYSQVDRSLAQDINRNLMDEIHAFFMESIGE
jgi:uncharacterized protein